ALILDPRGGLSPGFDRGFDTYDAGFKIKRGKEDRYATMERRGGEVVSRALLARAATGGPLLPVGPPLRRARSLRGAGAVPIALREGALRRRDRLRGRAGGQARRGPALRRAPGPHRGGRPRRPRGEPRRARR